jgi:AcrR family transcriptional regulator
MPRKAAASMRKSPRQGRARVTVTAILDAAAHILVREGYPAFSTNRVAERAGVSIGSLYQYFPNKGALITALAKRHVDDIEATLDAARSEAGRVPFAALVRRLIEANVAAHLIDPALHVALSDHLPDQGLQDWRRVFEVRAHAAVLALLQAHRREIRVRNVDLAAYVVMRSVEACMHEACRQRPGDLASGALAEAVTDLVLGYLVEPAPVRA